MTTTPTSPRLGTVKSRQTPAWIIAILSLFLLVSALEIWRVGALGLLYAAKEESFLQALDSDSNLEKTLRDPSHEELLTAADLELRRLIEVSLLADSGKFERAMKRLENFTPRRFPQMGQLRTEFAPLAEIEKIAAQSTEPAAETQSEENHSEWRDLCVEMLKEAASPVVKEYFVWLYPQVKNISTRVGVELPALRVRTEKNPSEILSL